MSYSVCFFLPEVIKATTLKQFMITQCLLYCILFFLSSMFMCSSLIIHTASRQFQLNLSGWRIPKILLSVEYVTWKKKKIKERGVRWIIPSQPWLDIRASVFILRPETVFFMKPRVSSSDSVCVFLMKVFPRENVTGASFLNLWWARQRDLWNLSTITTLHLFLGVFYQCPVLCRLIPQRLLILGAQSDLLRCRNTEI